jgi:hypothetical protein
VTGVAKIDHATVDQPVSRQRRIKILHRCRPEGNYRCPCELRLLACCCAARPKEYPTFQLLSGAVVLALVADDEQIG